MLTQPCNENHKFKIKQEMIISYFFIAMDKHVGQNYKIESTKMKKIKKKIKTKFTK